jgi:hypothetical protein
MYQLLYGKAQQLPFTNLGKAIAYVNEYIPFYKAFQHSSGKLLDPALWSFGKHMKSRNMV